MILLELFQRQAGAYQELSQDNSQPRLGDLRKTKLTLGQINKLRRFNDVRAVEFRERLEQVQRQYAPPAQPAL
jgi:hypothetical protein